jgi:Raf kinase inhibitor-like YbhB/YbcL family protein
MQRRVYRCGRVRQRFRSRAAAVVAGCVLVAGQAGCSLVGTSITFSGDAPVTITVTSPVLIRGVIPDRYTCHGAGLSPPLHWSGAPPGTKTLALVADDSDAPITPYIYWIVFDINPTTTDIQAGQLPPGARQARNSAGYAAYDPPCPHNREHAYRFTVYALRSALSLPNRAGLMTAWVAIARAAIARGRLNAIARP